MSGSKPRPKLDRAALESLALRYVERYATTEAKLARYLERKLRERGWAEPEPPPVDSLVERLQRSGFLDDRSFAEARVRSLARRGYGARRIDQALGAAGIERDLRARLADEVDEEAAARRYAERRRFGPYAAAPLTPEKRRAQFAAMLRAGHSPDVARRVLSLSFDEAEGLDEAG